MINLETLDLSSLPSLPLSDRKQLPAIPCIYFAMSSGTVQYIGMSKNLQQRWSNHHQLCKLSESTNIVWLEISNPSLLPEIENALIQWFKPPLNKEFSCFKRKGKKLLAEDKGGIKNRISELIAQLGITAYRFSEDTGISKNTVYLLKNNPSQFPSQDIFDRIIRAYKVTPNDIVEWTPKD